jgi:NAD(P) transhydrogenase subunit beta
VPESLQSIFYLIAGVLFIRSLAGLSQQKNARMGNMLGILGMALALAITFGHDKPYAWEWAIPALLVGGFIGWLAASKVEMTAMPELVAILHSFVGLAAVLVGFATYLAPSTHASTAEANIHLIEVFAAIAIGAVTLMGSIIAWAKLRGTIGGSPLLLPGRHVLNLALVVGLVVLGVFFVKEGHTELALQLLMGNALLSTLLGLHLVLAIGGADMPVVVSLLNSYSGWAASAAGFMLNNDLLIVTGALVGSSGAILSYIMCRGMNRSIWNVVFGGFGVVKKGPAGPPREYGEVISADAPQVAAALMKAKVVVIIPGYGMAVARAQHAVSELTRRLNENGCEVLFGVHEVAGRMPGHMNVLLAEADSENT